MNRVVISVPRVLDSGMVMHHDANLSLPVGNLPAGATAPFVVTQVKAVSAETQIRNTNVTRLGNHTRCSRVTATVTIPVTLSLLDANNQTYETHSSFDYPLDIILYIPADAAFPYTITAEAALGCSSGHADDETATLDHLTTKILVRVAAVTDLLIPAYGYAPVNPAEHYQAADNQNFINQPLFPIGKVY